MSRADDRLDELLVVELPVGHVGGMAAAPDRFGDGARGRGLLISRLEVALAGAVARLAPDVLKGGPPGAACPAILAGAARRLCVPPGPRASPRRSRGSPPI